MKEQLIQFLATLPLEDRALNAIMQAVNTIEDESYMQGYSYGMDVANSINEHAGIPREPQIKGSYDVVAIAGSYDQLRA